MSKRKYQRGIFDTSINETPTQQEDSLAERVGGRRVPRSGAYRSSSIMATGSGYGSDVEDDYFCYECKLTKNESISLKIDWLKRITIGAKPKGKNPALHIQFNGLPNICDSRWVLIEENIFREMLDAYKNQIKKESET